MSNENTGRVLSLDLLRGIAMVVMALDHIRVIFAFSMDETPQQSVFANSF